MAQDEERRFIPPIVGMLPGETVLWSRRGVANFWALVGACSTPIFIMVVTEILGIEDYGIILALLFGLGGIPFLILIIYYVKVRPTWYYLTSERVILAERDFIKKEIPLAHLAGRPTSEFMKVSYTRPDLENPLYRVRFYDSTSDETIEFAGMNPFIVETLQLLSELVECPQCGYKNTALSNYCKNCGAPL